MLVDRREQVPLDRWDPDPDPVRRRAGQALALVTVVMRHQDIRDPIHPDVGQMVEDIAAPEVDQGGVAAGPDHVNVAGVLEANDILGDRRCGHRPAGRWTRSLVTAPISI